MKLSKEQISEIDVILFKVGIKYDDIKIELLDHIASEIEAEMKANQSTFNDVFSQVMERWKTELKPIRVFLSLNTFYPKLVRNKFSNQIARELVTAIAISLLLFLCFQFLSNANSRIDFIFWIKKMFFYSYFGTVILILILKILNKQSTVTSTYKSLFDNRFPAIIVWLCIVFNDNIPKDIFNQNLFMLTIGALFVFLYSTIYLGFKHYQFQRKFSM